MQRKIYKYILGSERVKPLLNWAYTNQSWSVTVRTIEPWTLPFFCSCFFVTLEWSFIIYIKSTRLVLFSVKMPYTLITGTKKVKCWWFKCPLCKMLTCVLCTFVLSMFYCAFLFVITTLGQLVHEIYCYGPIHLNHTILWNNFLPSAVYYSTED